MQGFEGIGKAIEEGLNDNRILQDYAFNRKIKKKIEGLVNERIAKSKIGKRL